MTATDELRRGGIRVSIDVGGTFTDVVGMIPSSDGSYRTEVLKLLSVDPGNYQDAAVEGIRRILKLDGVEVPRSAKIPTKRLQSIRMGTTVATNALLEHRGEPCALVITAGFKDLLKIGTQSRPDIFDLSVACPDVLYEKVVEVDER